MANQAAITTKDRARAYDSLGNVCQAQHDPSHARRHWQQALTLYTRLGLPEADKVRARLTAEPLGEATASW